MEAKDLERRTVTVRDCHKGSQRSRRPSSSAPLAGGMALAILSSQAMEMPACLSVSSSTQRYLRSSLWAEYAPFPKQVGWDMAL